MMSWISQVQHVLVHEDAEVIILGERSAQELVAHYGLQGAAPGVPGMVEPGKPTQFMGVPVVPTRGINKLLVEIHVRDPYTGMAKFVRFR